MAAESSKAKWGAAAISRRWLARAPIALFTARLGAIFGSRLIMVEHIGRTSGLPRLVVLEVMERSAPGQFLVASGFGPRAQWYQNVLKNPRVRLWVRSRRPVAAVARTLSPAEARLAFENYQRDHPRAWKTLGPVLERLNGGEITDPATEVPMVEFREEGAA